MKRTSAQILETITNLGLESYLNGVDIIISNDIIQSGKKCDGMYLNSFRNSGKPTIIVRPIKDRCIFEFVFLHELGHHIHHTFMPNCTKTWSKEMRESFANNFASGGYERFVQR